MGLLTVATTETALRLMAGESVRYVWRTSSDVKKVDGVKVKGPDGYLWRWGACALREELKDMTEPQLQGCYRALVEVLDGSPTNAPGLKDEVLAAVKRMRGHVREWIDLARQRHEDATAKLPVATDPQSATSAEQVELDRTQLRRQARRESERKAYQLLLDHGDWLAQPCERSLVTAIPFGCRALVVARWARCVDDLISATHNRLEAERKGQGVEAATVHASRRPRRGDRQSFRWQTRGSCKVAPCRP